MVLGPISFYLFFIAHVGAYTTILLVETNPQQSYDDSTILCNEVADKFMFPVWMVAAAFEVKCKLFRYSWFGLWLLHSLTKKYVQLVVLHSAGKYYLQLGWLLLSFANAKHLLLNFTVLLTSMESALLLAAVTTTMKWGHR